MSESNRRSPRATGRIHEWSVNSPLLQRFVAWACCPLLVEALFAAADPFPGTRPLLMETDPAGAMVAGMDRWLDRHGAELATARSNAWSHSNRDEMRAALRRTLGLGELPETPRARLRLEVLGEASGPGPEGTALARQASCRVSTVSWEAVRSVRGEGLLLEPTGSVVADVVWLPDCDALPESACGLGESHPPAKATALAWAAAGCRVLVLASVDRGSRFAGNPGVKSVPHSQRETLWRAGWEFGVTPIAYDVRRATAAATALGTPEGRPLLVVGHGEGGVAALMAAAVDERFQGALVAGAFGLGARQPELPVYRNLWSVLTRFTDAEVGSLVGGRRFLVVEHGAYPEVTHTDKGGAAPGKLWRPAIEDVRGQVARARALGGRALLVESDATTAIGDSSRAALMNGLGIALPSVAFGPWTATPGATLPDAAERTRRQYMEVLEDTQWLMRESSYRRTSYWKEASTKDTATFERTAGVYRERFADEVVGRIPKASVAPDPRSRWLFETNGVTGYEVRLEVHPDVFAYGMLLVPKGIQAGERRPVVVCQHGLEGRPTDVSDPFKDHGAYHRYGFRLAELGFITFAPQNPYIGETRFRQVLRKAQPMGITLWSFIWRQHEVITDWLAGLPIVDPNRVAFYGLSYGGKTAMRVPVLVPRYCLSICSADYNEWIWKNASARSPYSYLWTSEYDMPEWNLGNTFNYAELSWLIFPRPFMVERGHDDGVAPDEWVAHEYARTRRHYVKMGMADRTEIEFFDGPHTIHGVGTFQFLRRHLKW